MTEADHPTLSGLLQTVHLMLLQEVLYICRMFGTSLTFCCKSSKLSTMKLRRLYGRGRGGGGNFNAVQINFLDLDIHVDSKQSILNNVLHINKQSFKLKCTFSPKNADEKYQHDMAVLSTK